LTAAFIQQVRRLNTSPVMKQFILESANAIEARASGSKELEDFHIEKAAKCMRAFEAQAEEEAAA
jgi:hypothetical protein